MVFLDVVVCRHGKPVYLQGTPLASRRSFAPYGISGVCARLFVMRNPGWHAWGDRKAIRCEDVDVRSLDTWLPAKMLYTQPLSYAAVLSASILIYPEMHFADTWYKESC